MDVTIPKLNLSKLLRVGNKDVYLRISKEQNIHGFLKEPIYRYMSLDTFCEIISGRFKINPRGFFSDRREHGFLYNPFIAAMRCVDVPHTEQSDKEDKARIEKENSIRKMSRFWLTTCFTKKKDDIFFWKTYIDKYGICIETTIDDILAAIVCKDYNICIGDMEYRDEIPSFDINQYAFSKYKAYSSEDERRIYFIPDQTVIRPDLSDPDTFNPHAETFEVCPDTLIKRAFLSPFLNGITRRFITDLLTDKAPWLEQKINKSKILEK